MNHKLLQSQELNTKSHLSAWKKGKINTRMAKQYFKKLSHTFGLGHEGKGALSA